VQAVFKVPDNAVSHLEAEASENRIEDGVQRYDGAGIYVVSNLPTNAPLWRKAPDTFMDNSRLLLNIGFQLQSLFVLFPDVIRR
jgi:hypothetical protein